jgi:hypothetical protein
MIPNRQTLLATIGGIVTNGGIAGMNTNAQGPQLTLYLQTRALRQQYPTVSSFLACSTCVRSIYDTLISWGMNIRGAKMKPYAAFVTEIQNNSGAFQNVEASAASFSWTNRAAVLQSLSALYASLALMTTSGKLVSNSKCFHFVFPSLCLPMDRKHTLQKLYGNQGESPAKFLEVLEPTYDVIAGIQNPQQYFDNQWNTCETKLVDNAIWLM